MESKSQRNTDLITAGSMIILINGLLPRQWDWSSASPAQVTAGWSLSASNQLCFPQPPQLLICYRPTNNSRCGNHNGRLGTDVIKRWSCALIGRFSSVGAFAKAILGLTASLLMSCLNRLSTNSLYSHHGLVVLPTIDMQPNMLAEPVTSKLESTNQQISTKENISPLHEQS